MDLSDFFSVMIKDNTFNGKVYSMPFNKSMPVIYVNLDMMKKAGIKEIPKTHKELMEAYKNMHTAFSSKDVWNFLCLILQNGGKITNEEETKAYLDSEAAVKALTFLMNLVKNKYATLTTGYDHQNEFIAKKVGIIISSIVSKLYMQDSITFNWTTAPLAKGVKKAAILSGTNVVIFNNNPKNCSPKQQKAAWEFIKWFSSTEITAKWSAMTTYMPVRKSALKTKIMTDYLKKDPMLKAALDQLEYAYFEPRTSKWYECRQIIGDILDKAFTEKGDPRKYVKEMNEKVNKVLGGK
jgi:multiple sugar transport system substrate-binding protein